MDNKATKKPTTKEIGDLFEDQVYKILNKTAYFDIEQYNGGGDRGRDIVVKYEVDGEIKKVHVECKSRQTKVNINDIRDSVDWAVASDQDLYYIWTNSFFQPNAKDYLSQTSKKYNLNVTYEEKKNIDAFLEALEKNDKQAFVHLTNKIFKYLKIDCFQESITSLYDKFEFKLSERISEYCIENQIECTPAKNGGLLIKFNKELINISYELNYRYNLNGVISIFINNSIRCSDMKFPSLILEVINKKIRLSTLSSFGNLSDKLTESFTNADSLINSISDQILYKISRMNYDQIYS